MNYFTKQLMLNALKYGLKALKKYMSNDNFKITVDQVLDRVEDHYEEGSFKDQLIEEITQVLREYFEIPDNDSVGDTDSIGD